jgi:hypothetical protein
MVYFPPIEKATPRAEKCPGCGDWYLPQRGPVTVSCCVIHPPGSCCHMGETKVPAPC